MVRYDCGFRTDYTEGEGDPGEYNKKQKIKIKVVKFIKISELIFSSDKSDYHNENLHSAKFKQDIFSTMLWLKRQ